MNLPVEKRATVFESTAAPNAHRERAKAPTELHHSAAENPPVVLEPSRSWVSLNLRDLWVYRELLYFLTLRDVKVRYKQTILGVAWVVMQPLLTTIIFTVFLGMLVKVPSDGIPYPLFAYTGLLPWAFFSGAVANSSNSLVGSAHLITKVYFPRMIIPGAAVGARLVDFAISAVILVGLMIYYGVGLTWSILMLPALVLLIMLLTLGLGMWTSALNVKYRDVGVALPVLIQLGMYVSPVLYPLSLVPERWRWLYALNPLVGILENFRAALLGKDFNWYALTVSVVVTLVVLVYASYDFRRMERGFADIV